MRLAAAILLASVSAAAAQTSYTIQLSPQQLDYIGKMLGKQPYEDVWQLMGAIQQQVNQQQQEAAAKEKAAKEKGPPPGGQ
jgi:ribosomal 50S subunit-associated protein YjgA (DUF615 family)